MGFFIHNHGKTNVSRVSHTSSIEDIKKELNIDTNKLLDKTIPYGEGEMRYQNLIKYISYANEIQAKIKKEIN